MSMSSEVLVVEDDSPIRTMLSDLLHDAGYHVVEAANGIEAMQHLRERRPDLIVLDLMLPGLSGWQFLERSRGLLDDQNIPVIVLSAIRGHGDYPATLGVLAWFTKPLDVPRFLGVVEDLTGQFAPPAPATAPTRVLVVEDEVSVRNLITEYLEGEGYVVEVASSVEEARQRISEEPPDLILLDLMLPGHSGWQFLEERRNEAPLSRVPVLVISAAPHQRLLDAKDLGADGFLSKPFDLDLLSSLVRSFAH